MVPVPVLVAVKVVRLPLVGEKVPRSGVTDQEALAGAGLPYLSAPEACSVVLEPSLVWTFVGAIERVARPAAMTVSVWVALLYPGAVAVSTGVAALVSL